MLQVKNTLGGGKPEGLYAWKKSEIGMSDLQEFNKSASRLPYTFDAGCAVIYNNEIHILGSTNYRTSHYKWNGSAWESVSTLPYNFRNGCAVVYNNEIHILGSSDSSTVYKYHYKWDGSKWTSVSTLPYSFYQGCAVVYNNEIHILGSVHDSAYYKYHYKWDGSSWTEVSTLPYAFYEGCTVVYNSEIHILGSNAGSPIYSYHYKWNGSIWENVSTIPYPFRSGSAVVFDGNIHIFGGTGTSYATKHYKWDGSSWTSVNTLPISIYDGGAVVLDNIIYILYSINHYSIIGYVPVYTFLDYIVSDKETAYPDGAVQDGYYYERVTDDLETLITALNTLLTNSGYNLKGILHEEDITPTGNVTTLPHTYGKTPTAYIVYALSDVTNITSNYYVQSVMCYVPHPCQMAKFVYSGSNTSTDSSINNNGTSETGIRVRYSTTYMYFKVGVTYRLIVLA